jgi:hypothetical protein
MNIGKTKHARAGGLGVSEDVPKALVAPVTADRVTIAVGAYVGSPARDPVPARRGHRRALERHGTADPPAHRDLATARRPQVILAHQMNGAALTVEHGAPLRLRVEHQLGYKMAKWVNRIELVSDFRGIGGGQGGWRDDVLNYYPSDAGI